MSGLLATRSVEKPWGRTDLPAPFVTNGASIGEIWFEPSPELPELLVKYIFTGEALSVQVHPDDLQSEAAGLGRQGKSECWLIVSAEPGAALGIGFTRDVSPEEIRAAALDGSIEQLLAWHPVQPGDFFYIPAGTVHAIGAGIGLIEVQQNNDTTYRLYDYGRPRELHLDAGVAVARGEPYPANLHQRLAPTGVARLVEGPPFRLDRYHGWLTPEQQARYSDAKLLVIPRTAGARVAGSAVAPGQCALANNLAELALDDDAVGLIARSL